MANQALTDPLGRTVTLHNRTWFGHILKNHPDLRAHRRLVEEVVTAPLEIRTDAADPANGRLYYGTGPRSGMMIVVAADVTTGVVLTAHLTKAFKAGAIEWSSPTP